MNNEIRFLAQQLLHGGLGPLPERDRRVIARVARGCRRATSIRNSRNG